MVFSKMDYDLSKTLIRGVLRTGMKFPGQFRLPVSAVRRGMSFLATLSDPVADKHVEKVQLNKIPAERHGGQQDTAILYLHGGIFVAGSAKTHRKIGQALATELASSVYVLDYRLAPEHPYPAAVDDAEQAWFALRAQGYAADQIVIAGDSAGGGLTLALATRLRDTHPEGHAAALVLISPFADLTVSSDSMHSLARRDPMLSRRVLARGGDLYRGELSRDDPRVSPIFADLHHLPPILIQVGSEEVLLDDALRIESRVRAAHGEVECQVWPDLWHDFQLFQGQIPEAAQAIAEIRRFLDDDEA